MCKGHKRGKWNRWKNKEEERLQRYEQAKQRGWYEEM
jgi:hypothetical protein